MSSTAAPDISLTKSGGETGTAITQTVVKGSPVETVTVSNVGGSVDSYTVSPAIPSGMTFETTTGRIYGAPTDTRTATIYTVTANSANGTDTATYTLTVNDKPPAFSLLSAGASCGSPCTDTGVKNTLLDTVTVVVTAGTSGAIDSYTVSPALPAGLSIDSVTGTISGTPTETITQTTFTITAHGPGGNTNVSYVLTISATPLPASIVFTGSAETKTVSVRIGDSLPTYTLTNSGGHVDSYTVSPTLTSPLQFDSSTGVISGSPTTLETATVYTITAHSAGGNDTVTYTLTVQQQQFALIVTAPSGGSISANPASGSGNYDSGTVVVLTASPSSGYDHGTWTGDCSGATSSTCSVTMTAARSLSATFTQQQQQSPPSGGGGAAPPPAPTSYNLTVTATGQGTVSPAGGSQAVGAVIALSAAPKTGWKFSNWTGDCLGTTPTCSVTMSSDKTVNAVFVEESAATPSNATPVKMALAVTVTGLGIVQASPAQPSGGYAKDASVQLTAGAKAGWSFDSWTGACSGTNPFCTLTMDTSKSVGAVFKATAVPDAVSAAWVQPQANGTTLASWEAASGAVQYVAELSGKTLCTSVQTSCTINKLIGPRDIVVVRALNPAGKSDPSPTAEYIASAKLLQLFTVNFGSGSSTLSAIAKTALNAAIKQIKSLGYTSVTVYGHTDNKEANAAALSLARAKAVARYIDAAVNATFVTQGKGATSPLTSNSTITGRAANRRVVGWVK